MSNNWVFQSIKLCNFYNLQFCFLRKKNWLNYKTTRKYITKIKDIMFFFPAFVFKIFVRSAVFVFYYKTFYKYFNFLGFLPAFFFVL